MTKIYTPTAWLSIFRGCPELIINDDGYIYNGADQYKFGQVPIGKIDLETGNIYGENYQSILPVPIAYIEEEDGVKKVYPESNRGKMFGVFPVLYIRDGEIYTFEDYNRVFPSPSAYMESDTVEQQVPPEQTPSDPAFESGDMRNPLIILVVLFIGFFGIIFWLYPPVLFSPNILVGILLGTAGSVVSYKRRLQKWRDAFITTLTVFVIAFVALFAVETLISQIIKGFKLSDILLIVPSPIIGAIAGVLPSAIGAWIVTRILKNKF